MSRRPSLRPPALVLASLVLGTALGGCEAERDPLAGSTPGPDADVPHVAAASASPFADLAGDTLVAPAAPALDIDAVPGALRFRWDAPAPDTRTLRLVEHDRHDGAETIVAELDPDRREFLLPVTPHRLDADALSWRVERCDDDGCVSSRRHAADGLVAATFTPVAPAVAIGGERFGERVSLNASGSLLVVARPVEGRVELHYPGATGVAPGDALARLEGGVSTTRSLDVASSASGDTVALLSGDASGGRPPRVVVFERLGEGWLESASFDAFPEDAPAIGADAARPRILLSDDGTRLLAACVDATGCSPVVHALGVTGWEAVATLDVNPPGAVTRAVAGSRSLARIAIVTAPVDGLEETDAGAGTDVRAGGTPRLSLHDAGDGWRPSDPLALSALAGDAPVAIRLDAAGERIAIGGLESSRDASPTPVLWRHRLERSGDAVSLDTEDSRRLPGPSENRVTTLSLAADAVLDTIAFGWQTAHEAALATYVRRDGAWVRALHLPDADGPFAKRRFGAALALAADGATLALDLPGAPPDPPTMLRAGRVLLMRARTAARRQSSAAETAFASRGGSSRGGAGGGAGGDGAGSG